MRSILGRKLNAVLGRIPELSWKPAMDLHKIISELQAEKQRLDEAIQALERLSTVSPKTKKRGRPPIDKSESQKASAASPLAQSAGH